MNCEICGNPEAEPLCKCCAILCRDCFKKGKLADTPDEQKKREAEQALKMIRAVTDGALDDSDLLEAVGILISQRDNARHYVKEFRAKLKELGHEYI